MSKRDDLVKNEDTGMGLLGALGTLFAIAGGVALSSSSGKNAEIAELENQNDRLRARNDQLKSELLGSWLNSDEIESNNRKIAANNNRIRQLKG